MQLTDPFDWVGYTQQGGVAVEVHSAGGLVAGQLINKHPHLLMGAILQMPFVDLWTCMSDPQHPLTTLEYAEWGNPEKNEDAKRVMTSD